MASGVFRFSVSNFDDLVDSVGGTSMSPTPNLTHPTNSISDTLSPSNSSTISTLSRFPTQDRALTEIAMELDHAGAVINHDAAQTNGQNTRTEEEEYLDLLARAREFYCQIHLHTSNLRNLEGSPNFEPSRQAALIAMANHTIAQIQETQRTLEEEASAYKPQESWRWSMSDEPTYHPGTTPRAYSRQTIGQINDMLREVRAASVLITINKDKITGRRNAKLRRAKKCLTTARRFDKTTVMDSALRSVFRSATTRLSGDITSTMIRIAKPLGSQPNNPATKRGPRGKRFRPARTATAQRTVQAESSRMGAELAQIGSSFENVNIPGNSEPTDDDQIRGLIEDFNRL